MTAQANPQATVGEATCATLQTPPGRGGIAVIAVIGPAAEEIVSRAFAPSGRPCGALPDPGELCLGHLADRGQIIDEAIVSVCEGGFEINIHGGPHVARRAMELLAGLGATAGRAAPAAPESFNPCHPRWNNPAVGMEMLQALPAAQSLTVAAAIAHQWSAGLSRLAAESLQELRHGGWPQWAKLRDAADALPLVQRLLQPPEVVLAGPPNVGKSSLMNALTGRQASIVHHVAGTTRDWVRQQVILEGLPVWLTDTAGIWATPRELDPIEAEAISRARARIDSADLVLLVEAHEPLESPPWLRQTTPVIRVANKSDILPARGDADVAVSAATGQGLANLARTILRKLGLDRFDPSAPMAFASRQAALLGQAAAAGERKDAPAAQAALAGLLGQ